MGSMDPEFSLCETDIVKIDKIIWSESLDINLLRKICGFCVGNHCFVCQHNYQIQEKTFCRLMGQRIRP